MSYSTEELNEKQKEALEYYKLHETSESHDGRIIKDLADTIIDLINSILESRKE